jgi:hypothetical protein
MGVIAIQVRGFPRIHTNIHAIPFAELPLCAGTITQKFFHVPIILQQDAGFPYGFLLGVRDGYHSVDGLGVKSVREESDEADSAIGPIITRSIEMELDIIERGCKSATEIMYAIARIDRQGNECWLARDGSWVARWSEDSDIQNIFGDQRTVTL